MAYDETRPVYKHEQPTESLVWDVNHGLNTAIPYCTVWVNVDGVNTVIIPAEIRIISSNECTITFSSPRAGAAIIN